MLSSIASSADGPVLVDYATFLDQELSIPEDARTRMKRALLSSAISRLDIYPSLPQSQTSRAYSYQSHREPEEPKYYERLKPYIDACFHLSCPDVLAIVLDKLSSPTTEVPKDVLERRVKHIILSLVAHVGSLAHGRAASEVQQLCELAIDQWMVVYNITPRRLIPGADIAPLIQAVIAGGHPALVLSQ